MCREFWKRVIWPSRMHIYGSVDPLECSSKKLLLASLFAGVSYITTQFDSTDSLEPFESIFIGSTALVMA